MTPKEFVQLFHKEKSDLLNIYFNNLKNTEVGLDIESLNLTEDQIDIMKGIIDKVLTDTMYTILLGIEVEASIGGIQQKYKLYDENGDKLTGCGEIEEYAYEYFQEFE